MPDEVDVNELDAGDLKEILGALKEGKVTVTNVAAARKEVTTLLAKQNKVLTTDDEGNFDLSDRKPAKKGAKVAAKAEPEPEPEPEPEDEGTEEETEETEEEPEAEAEEEVEEEAPPPKKVAAKAPAKPAAPPPKKVKAKEPEPEEEVEVEAEEEVAEEAPKKVAKKAIVVKKGKTNGAAEDEEVEAPKAKRGGNLIPRESAYKGTQKIKVIKKDHPFQEGSKRALKMAALLESKTVEDFTSKCKEQDLPTPSGFLTFAVKSGIASVS